MSDVDSDDDLENLSRDLSNQSDNSDRGSSEDDSGDEDDASSGGDENSEVPFRHFSFHSSIELFLVSPPLFFL